MQFILSSHNNNNNNPLFRRRVNYSDCQDPGVIQDAWRVALQHGMARGERQPELMAEREKETHYLQTHKSNKNENPLSHSQPFLFWNHPPSPRRVCCLEPHKINYCRRRRRCRRWCVLLCRRHLPEFRHHRPATHNTTPNPLCI